MTGLDQEIEYQQQQLQDIISQQTNRMSEGLEDEYEQLDGLENLDENKIRDDEKVKVDRIAAPPLQANNKSESNYNKLLSELLN